MEAFSLYMAVVRSPKSTDCFVLIQVYTVMLCAHILTVGYLLVFPANSFFLKFL